MKKTDIIDNHGVQLKKVPVLMEILDAVDKDQTQCRVGDDIYHIEGWSVEDEIRTIRVRKEEV